MTTNRTVLQVLIDDWKDCTRCPLHKFRRHVVFTRGTIPCDVFFIGEGPGESENILGVPFIGPAGKLMDYIVDKSLGDKDLTHAFGNLVGCIPKYEAGSKSGEPLPEEIETCKPRLQELVKIANPMMIVCVGGLARDYHDHKVNNPHEYHKPLIWWSEGDREPPAGSIKVVDVWHPAFILRANAAQQGSLVHSCIVTISNAAEWILDLRLKNDLKGKL